MHLTSRFWVDDCTNLVSIINVRRSYICNNLLIYFLKQEKHGSMNICFLFPTNLYFNMYTICIEVSWTQINSNIFVQQIIYANSVLYHCLRLIGWLFIYTYIIVDSNVSKLIKISITSEIFCDLLQVYYLISTCKIADY